MTAAKTDKGGVLGRFVLVSVYVVLVLSVSVGPLSTFTERMYIVGKPAAVISTIGKCAGLTAAMIVLLQFMIVARINVFSRIAR